MKSWALVLALLLVGCTDDPPAAPEKEAAAAPVCTNACTDYTKYWVKACPAGERCIEFHNSCTYDVGVAYQVGCNGDGTKGAPQCDCTKLPLLAAGKSTFWHIVNANYAPGSCTPWKPDCLTEGFEVMAHKDAPNCTEGTRIEFSAGNEGDTYGKFDSYNLDLELGFSVPVKFAPDLTCAVDHANHDCRPLWCGDEKCPDAYANPTQGGCKDGRSPQGGCQDTFNKAVGYKVEFCPTGCDAASCPSCEDATACP